MSRTSPQSATGHQQILGYGTGTKLGQYHDISELLSGLTAEEGSIRADSWWTLLGAGKATPSVMVVRAAVNCSCESAQS